jgi:hypothetical protein
MLNVIRDDGPGEPAFSLGAWDGTPAILFRWNGTDDQPIGNPQSRGLPTWIVLPSDLYKAVITSLAPDMQVVARTFLRLSENAG